MNRDEAVDKMRGVIRRQRKSLATERTYCGWLARYCHFVRLMPGIHRVTFNSEEKAEAFLTSLARSDVSVSTQDQAFNALNFFYKDVIGQPLKNVDALRATRPKQIHERV